MMEQELETTAFDEIEISDDTPEVTVVDEAPVVVAEEEEETPVTKPKSKANKPPKPTYAELKAKAAALERMVVERSENEAALQRRLQEEAKLRHAQAERMAALEKETATTTAKTIDASLDQLTELYEKALESGDTKRAAELHKQSVRVAMDKATVERIAAMPVASLPPVETPPPSNIPIAAQTWLTQRNFKSWDKDDQKIVDSIASKLMRAGGDAGSKEFYDELDKRLKPILPERYSMDDEEDEIEEIVEPKSVTKKPAPSTIGKVAEPMRGGIKREGNKLRIPRAELERIKQSMQIIGWNSEDPKAILEFISLKD